MANITEQSFKIIITVLSVAGLYPSEKNTILSKVKTYCVYLFFITLVPALTLANIILDTDPDIMRRNFMVMYVMETGSFPLKVLPFLTNGNRIKTCITYFDDPRFAAKDKEEANIIDECITICKRNSWVYFIGIMISESLWVLPLLVTKAYKFPVDVWLPYDKSNPLVFYATFLFIWIAIIFEACIGTLLDPLIGGLTYHATAQLKILKYNLQHLDRKVKMQTPIQYEEISKNLKRCIEHHNDIFNFLCEFENCFSWPIFCQIASSLLALCFALIGLISGPTASIDGMKNLICVILIPLEILFYCHYGTLLFEENNGLATAIYMGNWYRYDVKIRKVLIIIMERSKTPLIVTSGKVVSLTLPTFVSVVKMSYSLIALLNKY